MTNEKSFKKRLLRELKSEFGKYLVVFVMMAITIAFVSGFLVADGSMIRAYDDSFQKYNIEDGYFRTKKKLTTTQKEDIEKSDVKIYENFYIEQKLTNGSTVRFFKNRKDVDKVCLMKGRMPEKSGEIVVDRMYAENNSLGNRRLGKEWKEGISDYGTCGSFGLQCIISE